MWNGESLKLAISHSQGLASPFSSALAHLGSSPLALVEDVIHASPLQSQKGCPRGEEGGSKGGTHQVHWSAVVSFRNVSFDLKKTRRGSIGGSPLE